MDHRIQLTLVAIAIAATVLAVMALLISIIQMRSYAADKRARRLERELAQTAIASEIVRRDSPATEDAPARAREAYQLAESTQTELGQLARVLVNIHRREVDRAQDESGVGKELLEIYCRAGSRLEPFEPALREAGAPVARIRERSSAPEAARVVEDYDLLMDTLVDLKVRREEVAAIADLRRNSVQSFEELAVASLAPSELLRRAYAIETNPVPALPDPQSERERFESFADQMQQKLMSWVDTVSALRFWANQECDRALKDSCEEILRVIAPLLMQWKIELDDVSVGDTRFDVRQHELEHIVPRPDLEPETIIAVAQLGYRQEGRIVRKPRVVVAAAAG